MITISAIYLFIFYIDYAFQIAQELLDIRQRQQTGPQLVQQIRKQADDV